MNEHLKGRVMQRTNSLFRIGNKTMVTLPAMLFLSFLLASCGGHNARIDMLLSMVFGTIDKQEMISAEELKQVLVNHFGKVNIQFSASQYILPDNGKVVQAEDFAYCNPDTGDLARPRNWDCDDYAAAAMVPMRTYAFGTMYVTTVGGGRHALNVFVNRKREVKYWEPQECDYYYGRFYKPKLIVF